MPTPSLPSGYARIKLVGSLDELLTTRFQDGVNALCWPRELPGDYAEVAAALPVGEGITPLDEADFEGLHLSEAGRTAIRLMLADRRVLEEAGLDPELNCINGCYLDDTPGPVRTDVCSFHADSATVEADTYLCTYVGASSEGLRNDEAIRRADIAETRAALLRSYGGTDDAGFLSFLSENCYDLHYAPLPEAQPFVFGIGNLWRVALQYPGSPVPPCIHRAPFCPPGQPRRLLLIG